MKRTKNINRPDAILTSDWHLREDTPVCRTDNFETAQWQKVQYISELQKKYDCPVLHAGDLFHHWKPSPRLLTLAIRYLPDQFYTIYGQHDLPQHNIELSKKCGVDTLIEAGKIRLFPGGSHWGQKPETGTAIFGRNMILWHHLTYITVPFPGASGGMAEGILRKYPQFDLIVTGDNHQSFTIKYQERLLVNPGNITRQTADQNDFKPCVYFWYAETNTTEPHYLPITEDVVTREHIDKKERRDARIDAFVSRLNTDWQTTLDFTENLKQFEAANEVRKEVMEIIYAALEN